MRNRLAWLVLCGSLLVSPPAWATTYTLDTDHTAVSFKIRHLLTKVQGTFNEFSGTFVYVPGNPGAWTVNAVIQAASIDTAVAQRDKHLRSKDFFEVETYPTITFTSTQVTEATAEGAKLHGNLSMHGVERPVVLDLEIHGEATDPWGNARSGFTATTTVNRKDFGLTWNQALETGQFLVGEDVTIVLEIEGIAE